MNERLLQDTALRYFLEVVRSGSINKASVKLHVAPSAISRQIARLETELKTQLFERRASGMQLTASGELLAAHARRVRLEASKIMGEIMALEGVHRGTVHLASVEGLATDFLPYVISRFRQRYAGIHFDLWVCPAAEVTQRVREGNADIGLTLSMTPQRDIKVEKRLKAPINAIVSTRHPLATKEKISLVQLTSYPLALPYADSSIRTLFDVSCSRQGLVLEPVLFSNYMNALVNFALNDGGVALFGELSVRHRLDHENLVVIPIKDRELSSRYIEIQTLADRLLPKSVATFLGDVCQMMS
ncbi:MULTISPECIES: LysR family transcriptional regulator [Halomonadaceae]|uniref:LysR family transcriptional regulator n=1 Tax=Halomonadaceae TaxID=28256 RepID=UPI001598C895|nr:MULTISPECIES: LysR family transcriptional regulator [Halomonas]QJQ96349.1 LysR family transcriptional regulator [Halomonas sp. PA5]